MSLRAVSGGAGPCKNRRRSRADTCLYDTKGLVFTGVPHLPEAYA